jgi:cytochrome P450
MTTPAATGCPVDESFDPLSEEFLADPFAVLAAMPPAAERPVFYAPSIGYYVLTRYADIEAVFRDHGTFSAAVTQAPLAPLAPETQQILLAGGHKPQPSMVSLDEPAHARLRKPAARAFSMSRVNAMIPTIEATAKLLDAVTGAAEFDLVAALAFPLPAYIVFSLMGVPERDFGQLKEWCGYRAALSFGRPAPGDQVGIAESIAAYRGYLRALVDQKAHAPGDDLTSDLLAIHAEDPGRLMLDEISSILFSLSFAGHETTTGLIGNTARRLLEDPARWAAVVEQPDLIPAAVTETLRFDPSVTVWRRVTTRPVTIGGVDLPAGARLFLWLAAAGRDGAAFGCPADFDLHRRAADEHLAFGKGLHYCLGANFGRLETQIAIRELALRFPGLSIVPDQHLTFHPNISFRGPQQLRVSPHR